MIRTIVAECAFCHGYTHVQINTDNDIWRYSFTCIQCGRMNTLIITVESIMSDKE